MVSKPVIFALALLLPLAPVLGSCGKDEARVKVGHGGGYLSAALYAAREGLAADARQFRSGSDIAYALLAGALDAGFVEAEKLPAFAALEGFDRLTVVGKVTYPYGATLVLRKGLNVRLGELGGLTVAASAPNCVLRKAFLKDARRLNADVSGIRYAYMPFDAMIPALEAGEADAAIIKGAYAVIALREGHSILYQNWEVVPGDECCPAIIDQAALVLLARRDRLDAVKPLTEALESAQRLSPDRLRRAVADNTVIPFEALRGQPVPEFSRADDALVDVFLAAAQEDHDQEEDRGEDDPDE